MHGHRLSWEELKRKKQLCVSTLVKLAKQRSARMLTHVLFAMPSRSMKSREDLLPIVYPTRLSFVLFLEAVQAQK